MREVLVCPACRGPLEWGLSQALCAGCQVEYELIRGVPILLPREAAGAHKRQQAEFFDRAEAEFEVTRPHGTPDLYRWLIGEKFRRSVDGLERIVSGGTALAVCGGSGMDAEFLVRAGARVVLADISLGAAQRSLERARRFGVEIDVVVADVEHLPFADRSVDLVYVHDGLHHLERPFDGLAEMARVARSAVSVNEPARAAATALAVHVRLSELEEEAGNVIERLDPNAVVEELERRGFEIVRAARYAMVYRHRPGKGSTLLSAPGIFPVVRAGIAAFNRVAGSIGNKFTVQALRT